MPSIRREKVYELLDDLVEVVGALSNEAFKARNYDDAAWLACAQDAVANFVDRFDDHVDTEAERRWDRANERALDAVDGETYLVELQAEARKLK